jgi:excisionase family DNA binding protein
MFIDMQHQKPDLAAAREQLRRLAAVGARPEHLGCVYSIAEAAAMCKVSAATIRKWARQGRIQRYGFRGAYRVRLADVLPLAKV